MGMKCLAELKGKDALNPIFLLPIRAAHIKSLLTYCGLPYFTPEQSKFDLIGMITVCTRFEYYEFWTV